jgi:cytochrome c2
LRATLAVVAVSLTFGIAAIAHGEASNAGKRTYQKCYSCHATEPHKNDLEGPSLYGVAGRRIASEPSFDYSPAMRSFAAKHARWTPALLDRFITDPETVVPKTRMTFPGMRDAKERAALLEYLKSLTEK